MASPRSARKSKIQRVYARNIAQLLLLPLLALSPLASKGSNQSANLNLYSPIEKGSIYKLNESALDLTKLKGKVVVINFWAPWCKPCLSEFPELELLYRDLMKNFQDAQIEFIALSVDGSKGKIEKFIKLHPVSFTVAYETQGALSDPYKISQLPSTIVFNQEGVPVELIAGFSRQGLETIEKTIYQLLKK